MGNEYSELNSMALLAKFPRSGICAASRIGIITLPVGGSPPRTATAWSLTIWRAQVSDWFGSFIVLHTSSLIGWPFRPPFLFRPRAHAFAAAGPPGNGTIWPVLGP